MSSPTDPRPTAQELALAPCDGRRRLAAAGAGSHRRYRTEEERRCLLETRDADIPGQLSIRLKAGQTVYWSGNTIHCGLYRKGTERLTVSAGWSVHEEGEPQPVDERLRWHLRDDVRGNLPRGPAALLQPLARPAGAMKLP